jgi:hypothetical protein
MNCQATLFASALVCAGFVWGLALEIPAGSASAGPPDNFATGNPSCPMDATMPAWPVSLQRPLVSVATAAETLGVVRREIPALIESGALLYAWNIACRSAAKAELRILAESLADYQSGKPSGDSAADQFSRVIRLIFPNIVHRAGVVATVKASDLAFKLASSSDHVFNLMREKSLRAVPGTICRRGRGNSPLVMFSSVQTFLQERRIA